MVRHQSDTSIYESLRTGRTANVRISDAVSSHRGTNGSCDVLHFTAVEDIHVNEELLWSYDPKCKETTRLPPKELGTDSEDNLTKQVLSFYQ